MAAALLAACVSAWFSAGVLDGQTRLAFEVASIKRVAGPRTGSSGGFQPGGRFAAINTRTDQLLRTAYSDTRGDIAGIPDWVLFDAYDVVASAGRDATPAEMRLMVRTLLEDRFKLRARVERQEQDIYALVVARADGRLGTSIKPADYVCGAPGAPVCGFGASRDGVRATGMPVSRIASFLTVSAGRLLEDRTGLTGTYDYTLVYRPDTGRPPDPGDERPNVFTALQEQLGLKLEPARGFINVLIVEHIERPTED